MTNMLGKKGLHASLVSNYSSYLAMMGEKAETQD